MTGSSTRCCRRSSFIAALAALWVAVTWPSMARAEGIEVRKAAVTIADDAYVLEADFVVALTPTLEDALNKGVSLYFLLEFELIRPRWFWFNDKIADLQQQYRLSYNALTRQYRIGVGRLYQNFARLSDALEFMSRVRRREEVETGALRKDAAYTAALRLRLDTSQLPRPFQLSALGSREWSVSSDWHRWTVAP
ncbi:MAG: DUF4390 domain-containing protein [Betaproteobacteria bacterium]|nr:DUF4390 domain-containing protein [Betaproteobacteria bacterium]